MGFLIYVLLIFSGLALSPRASGQDDCAAAQQARSALEKQLAEQRQTCDASTSKLRSEISRLKYDISKIQAERQAEVLKYTAIITSLEHQRDLRKAELSISGIIRKITRSTTKAYAANVAYAAYIAEEFKQVVMGLQKGNTTQLNVSLQRMSKAVGNSVKAASSFVSRELDEHLPAVKEYAAELSKQAGRLYQTHVANATWIAKLSNHLSTANKELKLVLSGHIKQQPTLATLDDPVIIQVIAYVIMGAPLLLLLLPITVGVASLLAPSKANTSASKSSKKKKSAKSSIGKPAPGGSTKATPSKVKG